METKEELVKAAMLLKDYYDIVFYINPEGLEIEDNGVRETNPEYRNKIDLTIQECLKEYPPKQLVEIKGPNEERVKTILETCFPT